MKRLIGVLLATCMLFVLLSACGGNGETPTEAPATGTEPVAGDEPTTENVAAEPEIEAPAGAGQVISMMGWYEEAMMEGVIAAVNAQLGGEYILEYTFVALTDHNNVLSTQLAARSGPDIIKDGANFPARIRAGNLIDISDRDFINDFNPAGFSLASSEGRIFGIPASAWFSGIWYNQDLLDEVGVDIPNTFDELLEVGAIIKEAGYLPFAFGLSDADSGFHSLVGFLENSFYNNNPANPLGVEFDSAFAFGESTLDGNINASVERWSALIEQELITPIMLGISNQDALNSFIAGDAAFFHSGPWHYSALREGGMNFGMMPHLSETGQNRYMVGGPAASFGINVNTPHLEGANRVLEALATLEIQQIIIDEVFPGSPSYRSGVETEMSYVYDRVAQIVLDGNIAVAWDRWGVNMPAMSMIDEAMAQLQGLISGILTVDQFVQALDNRANDLRFE